MRSHYSGDIIDFRPIGGESIRDLIERAKAFIDSVPLTSIPLRYGGKNFKDFRSVSNGSMKSVG